MGEYPVAVDGHHPRVATRADPSPGARWFLGPGVKPLDELRRRTGQPPVDDRLTQGGWGDDQHADENGRVSVEVADREEGPGIRGQHRFLVLEVVDANGQNGPIGRGGV